MKCYRNPAQGADVNTYKEVEHKKVFSTEKDSLRILAALALPPCLLD